jgi:hypothetical protein
MVAKRAVPRPALLLGWAGVIPFAFLTLAAVLGLEPLSLDARAALLAYGAAILSFLGGAQWGVLLPRDQEDASLPWRYGAGVLPALVGFLCLLAPHTFGLVGVVIGLLGLLAYDLSTVRRGLAPGWYGSLRLQLTGAVVLLLAVAAFSHGGGA